MSFLATSVSALLKARTASAHHSLDQEQLLRRLLEPQLDLATYGEILGVFFGFYRDYEMTVHRLCDHADLDWLQRAKLPLLTKDLLALGLPMPKQRVAAALGLFREASAYGLFYVMEGATLGGQIIAKHLSRNLNLDAEHGAAFFHSYGPQVMTRWRETQATLDSYGERGGDVDAVIAGASAGFAELQQRFAAQSLQSPPTLDASLAPAMSS